MPDKPKAPYTYAGAGVDIARGNALVDAIRGAAQATARPGAEAKLGGFGALFDLKAAGFRDPVLVATTDGVGTKLKLAIETGKHDTVGLDLVAMCVNDLVVQGAEPLFFLDYFATGALDVAVAAEVVKGIAEGCKRAGCALIGGETAEMPGFYARGDYDLAGFAVGAVEHGRILPRADIRPGDIILGVASSGIHSNGFSLVRKLVADHKLKLGDPPPFASDCATLGVALLAPTRLYVKSALAACGTGRVKAMAHITGGGLTENVPRVLPPGVVAEIDLSRLNGRPVFSFLRKLGQIEDAEMLRTFNCGVGLVVIAAEADARAVEKALADAGETVAAIGAIREGRAQAPAETRYRGALAF